MSEGNRREDELSEHDKHEIKLFSSYLHGLAAVERGEALDAPELLYLCVYGQEASEIKRIKPNGSE